MLKVSLRLLSTGFATVLVSIATSVLPAEFRKRLLDATDEQTSLIFNLRKGNDVRS